MEFANFGRPLAFDDDTACLFLNIFERVNLDLLELSRCNQYDVAIELKRLFSQAKHKNPLSLQKHLVNQTTLFSRLELCEYLNIDYSLWHDFYFYSGQYEQLDLYFSSASPVAIVQMKKRLKRRYYE